MIEKQGVISPENTKPADAPPDLFAHRRAEEKQASQDVQTDQLDQDFTKKAADAVTDKLK